MLGVIACSDPMALAEEISKRWSNSVIGQSRAGTGSWHVETPNHLIPGPRPESKMIKPGLFLGQREGNPNIDVVIFYTVKDKALTELRRTLFSKVFVKDTDLPCVWVENADQDKANGSIIEGPGKVHEWKATRQAIGGRLGWRTTLAGYQKNIAAKLNKIMKERGLSMSPYA